MLRSFNRHFNETVFRGPDNEGNGGGVEDTEVVDTGTDDDGGAPDDGGADDVQQDDRKLSVREQLKKTIAEASGDEPPAKPKREKTAQKSTKPTDGVAPAPAPVEPKEPTASAIPAPEALPKEAKAEWDKTPPAIQQAFIKREQDMAAGVEQLKQRYNLIDQAIAPHTDALRQMNATPGEAVNRMFLWFKALAGRPTEAFPALASSLGVDWKTIVPQSGAAVDPNAPVDPNAQAAPGAVEIPAPVKDYIGRLEQQFQQLQQYVQQVDGRFGNVEQNINVQNEARTRENLSLWSNGKPHFEEVRQDMAKMIESGIVPLKADGQVDLDTAYERAIYFNPEVRAKVLAEQQQANQQVQQQSKEAATTAQQTQVNKARKAAVSLAANTTPSGVPGPVTKKKPGEKLSVRESLKAAMAELRDQ